MRRIHGESLFNDVYGCDCTSVHQKTDKVVRTYGASGVTIKLHFMLSIPRILQCSRF